MFNYHSNKGTCDPGDSVRRFDKIVYPFPLRIHIHWIYVDESFNRPLYHAYSCIYDLALLNVCISEKLILKENLKISSSQLKRWNVITVLKCKTVEIRLI